MYDPYRRTQHGQFGIPQTHQERQTHGLLNNPSHLNQNYQTGSSQLSHSQIPSIQNQSHHDHQTQPHPTLQNQIQHPTHQTQLLGQTQGHLNNQTQLGQNVGQGIVQNLNQGIVQNTSSSM
ncbi:hypothetical protein TREMEDRAFT_57837, partial [Tremella mesenterica DSM 1558]|uniref:uncharacterized protein n=1 Tax=Tremella mesenterica (strain ATCC 24925 / CBS 8224 / DSM 1558 / NBRC 9311 / NRRL Y-6157 / RJB 2259-6 / UBC 559-6) TaxID=578456 RepID=UPI00032BC09E